MKTNPFAKRFTKKLKSNTGASILLALMFFLVCFFVASVVMASASVNASRALAQKEEQRSYFAIQSAENLIKDMFGQINGANRYKRDESHPEGNRVTVTTEVDGVTYSAYALGGFHFRDEKITYSMCDCATKHNYYGLWTSVGAESTDPVVVVKGNKGVINFNPHATESDTNVASYGINCIGDNSRVFLKSELEEVSMYAMSKWLYDEGTHSLNLPSIGPGKARDFNNAFQALYVDKTKTFKDLVYEFDIQPEDGLHAKNLPTVHVKMTTDEKANLTFRLTVESKYASTYSGTLIAHSSFESLTPPGYDSSASEETIKIAGENHYHKYRAMVLDTYLTWYTDDIEIVKGLKPEDTSNADSSTPMGDIT